jgi:prepilin-type N-terminal cleavage/methylation domain-containing protein
MSWHTPFRQTVPSTPGPGPIQHKIGCAAKSRRRVSAADGFSLIELMIVVSIIMIVSAISIINLPPALASMRLNSAVSLTAETLNKARGEAYSTRALYRVDFTLPNTITITQQATGIVTSQVVLPQGISFDAEPGIPTTVTTVPDGFGTGAANLPVDFGLNLAAFGNVPIYFYPDGSARDANGSINNGVVYLAQPGNLSSSRAITLWGLTGRVKRWALTVNRTTGVTSWGQL